jgi:steroid delta-isomerase-like uncharacterized protein
VKDRICLITGASSGIGKATAKELARQGATVVALSHDRGKLDAAVAEVRADTGNDRVDALRCDLASLDEVRRAADEFRDRYPALHLLVNNAGTSPSERVETPDGLEMTFVVNYLAHFLLTNLLVDLLTASAPARVINISTFLHRFGRINFDDLQAERHYNRMKAHNQAKLAMVLFTYELADRLRGTGVTVNCLHPGVTPGTGMTSTGGPAVLHRSWALDLQSRLTSTVAESSSRVVDLATSADLEAVTGQYFDRGRPERSSPASNDRNLARRLWERSEELAAVRDPTPVSMARSGPSSATDRSERQKAIFRRFAEEAWNNGNLDVVAETFTEDYHAHATDPAHDVHGAEGHRAFIAMFRRAFPDVHITFEQLLSDGEFVVAHMNWTGTHTGEPYMGIPASGKNVAVEVIGINRFRGDKVVEAWGVVDVLGMLQQLGVIPAMG